MWTSTTSHIAIGGLALLLVAVGLLMGMTGSAVAQSSDFTDIDATDLDGAGTEDDPYLITNTSELQAMEDDLGAHYELNTDINASGTARWNNGSGFDPIGSVDYEPSTQSPFTGSLDGNNHTVTGLKINRSSENHVGLIGSAAGVTGEITISDISLKNITVKGSENVGGLVGYDEGTVYDVTVTGNVSGSDSVGGLIGYNLEGSNHNVTAAGYVNGSEFVGGLIGINARTNVQHATTSGDINGDKKVGGLIGMNSAGGSIQNATSTGNVTGSDDVGGLVGDNGGDGGDGSIRNAKATANVTGSDDVGGLVGSNGGSIYDTFATGVVTGSTSVGGLVGVNAGYHRNPIIRDSYWDKQTTGQVDSAGANATGLTTVQMTGQAAESNMTGLAFGTHWETKPNDYPTLRLQTNNNNDQSNSDGKYIDVELSELAGDGTEADPYTITNASELQAMEDNLDAHYILANDINASNTAQWNSGAGFEPIGDTPYDSDSISAFRGSLDGNNHTVTKLTINRSTEDYIGLISFTGSRAVITNISLENITVRGSESVGSLIGATEGGTIQNTTATGNVSGSEEVGGLIGSSSFGGTIQDATAKTNVSGSDLVGGLIGSNDAGTVRRATAEGTIDGSRFVGGLIGYNRFGGIIETVTARGNVTGSQQVGGLIGYNEEGAMQNATATGTVTGTRAIGGLIGLNDKGTIHDVFAVGAVSGSTNVGGLVGSQFSDGTTEDSYWDIQTTGQSRSAGSAIGLTTAQMTGGAAEKNMTGLEFGTIWQTQSNDYPILRALSETNTSPPRTNPTVTLTNVSINSSTISSDSASQRTLTFEAQDVSADRRVDRFNITFPTNVELERVSDITVTELSSDPTANIQANTLNFTVNPTEGQSTRTLTVTANVTLSARN